MEFRFLGPLEVEDGGRAIELGGARPRALLAILLLRRNEVVPAESLLEDLYGAERPVTAAKSLQVHISRLRKTLGANSLRTRGTGYGLETAPDEVDADRFARRLAAGRSALAGGDAAGAERSLEDALALWRGPPLSDFAYQDFAQAEIARLEELRLACVEELCEARLALGRHIEIVGELEQLVSDHPLRERLRGQVMLALYRSGRQADALAEYRDARRALVQEIGIEPGRSLRHLEKAILEQDPSLDLASASEEAEAVAEVSRGAFVGREAQLDELRTGFEDALAGRGRLFLLVGEPGIGKSRLADELIRYARSQGARVLVGRCWEAGGAPAYWPWTQSLRTYIREVEPEALRAQLGAGAAQLAQILPELRDIVPGLLAPGSLEAEGARFRLFDATAEFLRNASESRPLLLVLDDLHAADAPSLLLLQFLARELGATRMLVLGAFRDVDPTPGQPLTAMLAELIREPVTRRLSLGGLSERDVAEYVELTASEIASPEFVAALHGETEGNPLFVGEIVRLLSVEGARSESIAEGRLAIPRSVRDVIARRLTHLSEECNRMLVLASVLGREFALDALARVRDVSVDDLLDTLDEAMTARVVADVPGAHGRLRFAHVLIRDTLYEGLTTARRVRLHRLAVEALEGLYSDEAGPYLAELAHHSMAGSDFDKGLDYARRAGDRALALSAYEEAARLYEAALEALELACPSDGRTRCELLLSLGEAEARAGNTPGANRAFLDAAELARRLGLPRELANAAAGYGGLFMWARAGCDARLAPLLEEGLAALAEEDVELRARLLARLAGALRDEHSRDRRDRLSREAVEVARRTGNPAALAYALDGRAGAIIAPDTVAECLALATEFRELCERRGDREGLANALDRRITARVMVGDVRGAEIDLAAESDIAHELRQPAQLWQVHATRAMFTLAAGGLTQAEEFVEQAFAVGERALPDTAITVYRLQQYTLCDFRGTLEEVEPAIRNLITEYPARPVFHCALAHLHTRLGRLREAKQTLDDLAESDFSSLPFDQEWLYGMSLLAETSTLLGETAPAAVMYELLAPWSAFNAADHPEGFRGSVSRYLGMLATTTSRWEKAALHFEDALATNASMGVRPWVALTQEDYARMLMERDLPGDSEKARDLLAQAIKTYKDVGMKGYAAGAAATT